MQGIVVIGQTDISNYIIEGTYSMDSEDAYESWKDGNFVEHRIIVSRKVKGKFNLALSGKNNMTLAQFKAMLNAADNNGVLTMSVNLTNTGSNKAIEAYYSLKSKEHTLMAGGTFMDVVTMEIQER